MDINMPLAPDPRMRDEGDLRRIKAEMPDDVTQEEFWNFVVMAGAQLFGTKGKPEALTGHCLSSWNPMESFKENFQRPPGS